VQRDICPSSTYSCGSPIAPLVDAKTDGKLLNAEKSFTDFLTKVLHYLKIRRSKKWI
jgi:hypothetical protein